MHYILCLYISEFCISLYIYYIYILTYAGKVLHLLKPAASNGEGPAFENLNNTILAVHGALSPYLVVKNFLRFLNFEMKLKL